MKIYKLWIEVEEQDLESGVHRSLCDDGSVSPVPIASFSDLEAAVRFAESLGVDALGVDAKDHATN